MKRSAAGKLAVRQLALGLIASAFGIVSMAHAEEQTFDGHVAHEYGHGKGHGGHGQLALPETTACLNAAITTGRSNNAYSGIAAAVVLDGRIVYRQGFGTVSPTSTQPVLPSTRFRLGSITKSLTATALLSLAQEHRVDLHAPVNTVLPGLELPGEPGWSDRLTGHRLLSHQGGIEDRGTVLGPRDDGALAAAFYDPVFLQTVRLMVAPGTFYNYSNQNFALAGLVAEAAAGEPYRLVLHRRVFKPLRMSRTTFLPSDVLADNDFAYGVLGNKVLAPDAYDNAIHRPAGFAWSTANDLAKYALFILHGDRDVLSPRMWRAMQTRQVDTREFLGLTGYGYGLAVDKAVSLLDDNRQLRFYDVKTVSHGGEIDGYRAFMVTLPSQRFGYVALVNGDATSPLVDLAPACFRAAAAETITDRLPPPSPFPDPDIQHERFSDYVGNYSDRYVAGPAVVTLSSTGALQVQLPALDAVGFRYDPNLQPIRRDNFLLHTQDGSILLTGIRGSGNQIEYLRARITVFARTGDEQTALRSAPSIDRQAIQQAIEAATRERDTLLDLRQ